MYVHKQCDLHIMVLEQTRLLLTQTTFTGLFTRRPARMRMQFKEEKKKIFNLLLEREYSETDAVIYIQNGVFEKPGCRMIK